MKATYKKKTTKSLAEAVDDVKGNLMEVGFGTLFELNFKDKLKEKGFEFDQDFILLEVCNPAIASSVLKQNLEIGYVLPCKMVVYEMDGVCYIGLVKPTVLIELMDPAYQEMAQEVESTLMNVINKSI